MVEKILIYESDKVNVKNFSMMAADRGYTPIVVSEGINSGNFINTIKEKVKEERPSYVLIGNVRGKELEVAEKVKLNKSKVIIYTNPQIVKKAKEKGYRAYTKRMPLEKIFDDIEKSKTTS